MILKEFYEAIMQRVLTNVSEVQYFEMFNNQYNNEEDELNFNLPAVFFEYTPIEWQTLGNKVQQAECVFNLHLVTETLSETSNMENQDERNAGLIHLTNMSEITKVLQGFNGTNFGTISRTGFINDNNHGQVLVSIISFKTLLKDDFSKLQTTPKNPSLEITTELEQ